MSKEREEIWRAARENVEDFPDCPEDMSEPAYANLAFSYHCHVRTYSPLCKLIRA